MKFKMTHHNYNVQDLERSLAFYKEAVGFTERFRMPAPDGSYIICFIGAEGEDDFLLELTWLKDHPQPYDLGEGEYHLGIVADDFEAAHKKHEEMGCICFENHALGVYFIEDPDGYWLEILPKRG